MPFDQKKYINEYNKNAYKTYQFRVKKTDAKTIEYLDNMKNRNSYIMGLVSQEQNHKILTIKEIKDRIMPIMKKYCVKRIYLFGSYARGEATINSDVDIYCDGGDIRGYIEFALFCDELEEALGKKVDVITQGSLMTESFFNEIRKDFIKLCLEKEVKNSSRTSKHILTESVLKQPR
ncbi:MAG: nucleotidyltransferase domain-containing protein [Bacilli bacterium]|nr:nucleotidyltransferase domain-containing protein [Bacilli bacterium]